MEEKILELLKILRQETDLYRDLIEHARKKTALLVEGRLESILESNKIDETYSLKLRMLEDEIIRLCEDLRRGFDIPGQDFNLLKLAEKVEHSLAREIRSAVVLFKNLLEQLKEVNQRNNKLVESGLRYSRGILDLIANATSSYQGSGLFKPYSSVPRTLSSKV